jgi:two-component SAPR family response regulator
VLDREGQDISQLFSPLLKELLLLLLFHSLDGRKGISSERLDEILWTGKSVKDARNNRSVNMLKLKGLLDRVGGYTIQKVNKKWVLHFAEEVYVDLQRYYQLRASAQGCDRPLAEQLVAITERGALLPEAAFPWLDNFKLDMSTGVITCFLEYLDSEAAHLAPAFVIRIAHCILHADSLCEEAIMYKCKALVALHQHATARNIYLAFLREYEAIYGAHFEKTYQEVVTL